jgi:H/ACA ribonucleoprotein complex subunit 2
MCIMAGDISPIDVLSHVPVLCEDNSIPYVFVPSKELLGNASQTKRPTSVVLVKCATDSSFNDKFEEALEKVKPLQRS